MAIRLSKRIKRLFLWMYFLSVGVVLIASWLLLEGLEETTLQIDKQVELEHFQNRHETDKVAHVQSAMLTMVYLPTNSSPYEHLPIIFSNRPIPFDSEVEFMGKEYRIIINKIPEGTYYLAKDLSQFVHYENLMVSVLLSLAGFAIISGFGFATLISHRITQPIRKLTQDIICIKQGQQETYLPAVYKDSELNEISQVLKSYLYEIDHFIKRERSLISMASHELRTPIAVILGAAEVIEQRQQLNADDKKTLQRIITSAKTMSNNVNALLNLVRQSKADSDIESFSLTSLSNELITDLKISDPAASKRVEILPTQDVVISSSKNLARLLLNNLVGNGLNHNRGTVWVDFNEHYLEVRDQGVQLVKSKNNSEAATTSGLGLYIVTLICEQLDWKFSLTTLSDGKTCAKVLFH